MSQTLDIDIFQAGSWGEGEWTVGHLDQMVANFQALAPVVKVPVKLGHDDKQILAQKDGQPALGWVTALWRAGDKLRATIAHVPQTLLDLIAKGRYRRLSSEIYPRWEHTGAEAKLRTGTTGPALSAVALLGADIPEVKSLDDLATLLASEPAGGAAGPIRIEAPALHATDPLPAYERERLARLQAEVGALRRQVREAEAAAVERAALASRAAAIDAGNRAWAMGEREVIAATDPNRIDLAEEVRWAEAHKRDLWCFGQREDAPNASAFVNALWEGAGAAALDDAMRATAREHQLDVSNYAERLRCGAQLLREEPTWEHGVRFADKAPAVQAAIVRHYASARRRAEIAAQRRAARGQYAERPTPADGSAPAYGRADWQATEGAHGQAVERAVLSERERANAPAPAAPLPPVGGYWY